MPRRYPLTDEEIAVRHERLRQAVASAALESIEYTPEDLAELDRFDQHGLTDEEAVAYLIEKYRQPE